MQIKISKAKANFYLFKTKWNIKKLMREKNWNWFLNQKFLKKVNHRIDKVKAFSKNEEKCWVKSCLIETSVKCFITADGKIAFMLQCECFKC